MVVNPPNIEPARTRFISAITRLTLEGTKASLAVLGFLILPLSMPSIIELTKALITKGPLPLAIASIAFASSSGSNTSASASAIASSALCLPATCASGSIPPRIKLSSDIAIALLEPRTLEAPADWSMVRGTSWLII